MKSKWSNVIKLDDAAVPVETYLMEEFLREAPGEETSESDARAIEEEADPFPHDCTILQQEAYETGHQTGMQEGEARGRAETEMEMQRAMDLVGQVGLARLQALQQAEQDIIELAMAIARKIIHREVEGQTDIVVEQVRQTMKYLSTTALVRVLVHPDEVESLESVQATLKNREGQAVPIVIEADPTIQAGGCRIESDTHVLDASIEAQLDMIEEELTKAQEEHGLDTLTGSS